MHAYSGSSIVDLSTGVEGGSTHCAGRVHVVPGVHAARLHIEKKNFNIPMKNCTLKVCIFWSKEPIKESF